MHCFPINLVDNMLHYLTMVILKIKILKESLLNKVFFLLGLCLINLVEAERSEYTTY
jgi:hypothetical protein